MAGFLLIFSFVLLSKTVQAQTASTIQPVARSRPMCAIKMSAASPTPVATGSEASGNRVVRDPDDHRIVIDSDGISATKDLRDQLDQMFRHIEQKRRRRLVLFIHGGLTTLDAANQNAKIRGPEIAHDDPNAYPLFLNWEAGIVTSYGRHLAYERNGISYRGTPAAWSAVVITPFVFFSDVGRSVANHAMNTVLNFSKVWIDEFFESPASFGDRTLGTFQNAVIAYRLLPQTSRIHLKAFGINRKDDPKGFSAGPQKHGDFGNFPFWKSCYWSTDVPLDQCYQMLP